MADESNGLIFGTSEIKFKKDGGGEEKTIAWIDENGMQPAGNAPQFLDVFAAQVTDGPVDSILQNPGSDAFTMNLIQLKAQNLVDIFGGTAGDDGSYTPPANFLATGVLTIKTHSGHNIRIFKARLSRNGFQNGLNMQSVFAFGIRVDMLKPAGEKTDRWKMYPPGLDPDTSDAS